LLPSQIIANAKAPDGSDIVLVRRGDEWMIRVGGAVLMSSRQRGSEEAMADVAFALQPEASHVLVGGLGLGYTLRAVLNRLGKTAKVVVAELLPEVVTWNRTELGALHDNALSDRRCEVVVEDVYALIKRSKGAFDVILLDVDNGPIALCDAGNQRLYNERGVRACFAALRPKGVLVLWSAAPSPRFDGLLSRVGFKVSTQSVAKTKGTRARHVLHIGQHP
jgi:spermidine synthase